MPYAIIVDFDLVPDAGKEFLPLVKANAAASLRDEPGCSRFDVLTPRDGKGVERVVLYEIYDDRTAFEAHLKTPHFRDFDAATAPLVRRKSVQEFNVSEGGV